MRFRPRREQRVRRRKSSVKSRNKGWPVVGFLEFTVSLTEKLRGFPMSRASLTSNDLVLHGNSLQPDPVSNANFRCKMLVGYLRCPFPACSYEALRPAELREHVFPATCKSADPGVRPHGAGDQWHGVVEYIKHQQFDPTLLL